MKLSTTGLKTERQWRSATGLDQPRFLKLLTLLPAAYEQLFGLSIQQRQAECPDQPALNSYEDLLLFTLFSLKSNLSYDLLGFTTGMDGSTAKRNQTLGLRVMEAALLGSGHAPKQDFEDVEAFKAYFATKGAILIDATEQRTQRPVDADYQKAMYSGKKSAHG
jgi:hypothetical protein